MGTSKKSMQPFLAAHAKKAKASGPIDSSIPLFGGADGTPLLDQDQMLMFPDQPAWQPPPSPEMPPRVRNDPAQRMLFDEIAEVADAVTPPATAATTAAKVAPELGKLRALGRLAGGVAAGFAADALIQAMIPGSNANQTVRDTLSFNRRNRFSEDLQEGLRKQAEMELQAAKLARFDRTTTANMETIRREAPELYQELLVGRKLPRGSVVFGGGLKPDYLRQVAEQMALGAYDPGEGPEIRLSGTLDALQKAQLDKIRFSSR